MEKYTKENTLSCSKIRTWGHMITVHSIKSFSSTYQSYKTNSLKHFNNVLFVNKHLQQYSDQIHLWSFFPFDLMDAYLRIMGC